MMTSGKTRQKVPRKAKRQRRIELLLPIKPLSTNDMYAGRKTRSWQYKSFRLKLFKILSTYEAKHAIDGNMILRMTLGFSSKASDLSNGLKAAEDVLMEYFGMDDKYTVDIYLKKHIVYRGDEFIKVSLAPSRRRNVDLRNYYKKGEAICGM